MLRDLDILQNIVHCVCTITWGKILRHIIDPFYDICHFEYIPNSFQFLIKRYFKMYQYKEIISNIFRNVSISILYVFVKEFKTTETFGNICA